MFVEVSVHDQDGGEAFADLVVKEENCCLMIEREKCGTPVCSIVIQDGVLRVVAVPDYQEDSVTVDIGEVD